MEHVIQQLAGRRPRAAAEFAVIRTRASLARDRHPTRERTLRGFFIRYDEEWSELVTAVRQHREVFDALRDVAVHASMEAYERKIALSFPSRLGRYDVFACSYPVGSYASYCSCFVPHEVVYLSAILCARFSTLRSRDCAGEDDADFDAQSAFRFRWSLVRSQRATERAAFNLR